MTTTSNQFNAPRKQKCGCVKQWHCGGDWTVKKCKKHKAATISHKEENTNEQV